MSDERQDPPVQEPQEQAPPVQEPPPPHPSAAIVDEWWQNHIVGSVVGRSTEAWNYLQGKLDALKSSLAAKL